MENLKKAKKREISSEMIMDTWLVKYHNITYKEAIKEMGVNPYDKDCTRNFYSKYTVTQEQHDEWLKEVKPVLRKKFNMSEKSFDSAFALTYLNIAPSTLEERKS